MNVSDVGLSVLRRFLHPKTNIPKVAFVSLTYMCLIFCFINPSNDQMVHMKTEANWSEGLETCKTGTNCWTCTLGSLFLCFCGFFKLQVYLSWPT